MKNFLKKRLIPVILIKDGFVVQSINFSEYKVIGKPVTTISRLNKFGSDEIILLDISKVKKYVRDREEDNSTYNNNFLELINEISKINFVPLSGGGGIRNLQDIENYLKRGCDKVVINTLCINDINLVKKAAKVFGSQCLIGSIDYKLIDKKKIVIKNGKDKTNLDVITQAKIMSDNGIGEIIINSVDRDGLKNGYDIELIAKIVKEIDLPIISCGGAGSWDDMYELVKETDCDAVAASNIFHHVEYSTFIAKQYLFNKKLNFRNPKLFDEK